jgi:hypothetical protein
MTAPRLSRALPSPPRLGLAEFFTRKRRMALPSIILLLAFVGGVWRCGLSSRSSLAKRFRE